MMMVMIFTMIVVVKMMMMISERILHSPNHKYLNTSQKTEPRSSMLPHHHGRNITKHRQGNLKVEKNLNKEEKKATTGERGRRIVENFMGTFNQWLVNNDLDRSFVPASNSVVANQGCHGILPDQ